MKVYLIHDDDYYLNIEAIASSEEKAMEIIETLYIKDYGKDGKERFHKDFFTSPPDGISVWHKAYEYMEIEVDKIIERL